MATAKDDDLFESSLNETSKKRAKDELNERNDLDRKTAVQTFRQWVLQKHWLKTPTDFRFLLRFLRVRKYSQLGARETLENFWTSRTKRPEWHKDLDPADPILQELFRSKLYFSPLKCDKDGCRWMFTNYGSIRPADVDRYGKKHFERAMVLFLEWLCYDENVQVNGLNWFMDYTDLSMAVVRRFANPDDQRQTTRFIQKASPIRLKAVYIYNEPTFFDFIYAMYSVFSSPKILDRVKMIGKNMTKLFEKVDMSVLPDEYLPDDYNGPSAGSESQIIEDMIADMTSSKFRSYIRDVTSSKYGIDFTERSKGVKDETASFRKLNID